MKQSYTVTKDADRLAPAWLAARINYTTIKLIYVIRDGAETLKGVRIGEEFARIGDSYVNNWSADQTLNSQFVADGYTP